MRFIEVSRKKAQEIGSTARTILAGWFTVWDDARIKKAFNAGNGSRSDFIEYAKANRDFIAVFEETREGLKRI